MVKLRFIHTADIHLGSFLHIAGEPLPPSIEATIETATLEGFRRVCDTAIGNDVDFVVISGDLYDREARSVKALGFFVEQCKRLKIANIDVFVIAGNHDPLREKQDLFEMPDNVKIFRGDQPEIYEVLDKEKKPLARIIGQSYQSKSIRKEIHLDYKVPDTDLWNIALLHTQLEPGTSDYIPCSLGDLKERSDIHYWALGHIHQPKILNNTKPYMAYPGIPQGRDFGEEGRGGCMLVELDPYQGGSIAFIPTATVIYKRIDIFVDDDPDSTPETLQDLEDKICEQGDRILDEVEEEDYPIAGYVVEWILRGRSVIHDLLKEQEQESLEMLTKAMRIRYEGNNPFLWTNSVTFRTQSPIDYDGLMKNSPVLGELEKVIQQCLEDPDMRNKLIKELGDIWGRDGDHETSDDFRFHMDETTLEEMLYNAKQLIIEKLAVGRE